MSYHLLIAHFFLLFGWAPFALAAEGRPPNCGVYAAAGGAPHFAKQMAAQFHGTSITARDGRTFRIKATVEGKEIALDLMDAQNRSTSGISLTVSRDGRSLSVDTAFLAGDLQGKGVTSQLLKRVFELAPVGAKLKLVSENAETSEVLNALRDKIMGTREYQSMVHLDPPEAERYLRTRLTAAVRRRYEEDKELAPVWYRVLAGSGWQNIRIAPTERNPDKYYFRAEKEE